MDLKDIKKQDKFIHRDTSWLDFNQRVLEEAEDTSNPLLERAKFLAIFVNNLDEFFMVRVAGLKRLIDSEYSKRDTFGYYTQEVYEAVKIKTRQLIDWLYDIFYKKIRKELEKKDIFIKKYHQLDEAQQKFVKLYFETTVFPLLTPMAVDPGRPFPVLPSKTIAFAVFLSRYDKPHFAIVTIPANIPRLVRVLSQKNEFCFILLEDIIREYLISLFKGFKIMSSFVFRLMRDSELSIDEDFSPDLLKAIDKEVKKRPRAKVVYLEVEKNADAELLRVLCDGLKFEEKDVIFINGDFDLSYLFSLYSQLDLSELFYEPHVPRKIPFDNIFEHIKEGDFFLHVPFQSFQPTIDFLQAAAQDEDVLGIKMTLYRTDEDSAIIAALKQAAQKKKQVTVLVELKARFDEERNIRWSRQLEEAGCHVIYGIAGMKIHSKMLMVIRKEEGRVKRYVHLSTGNYNEKTAGIYTDIGYFTSNEDFAKDISDVFNVITGYSLPSRWQRVVSAPFVLREYLFELIDKEIDSQKRYNKGFIFAKMNSLEDPAMIEKLYEASQAGVKIQLIVRGICCLIPGVKGLSEHIQIHSIAGRYLEHTRIFVFGNNENERVFLSSADWMRRNFDSRIELLFEIYNQALKETLQQDLKTYWKDTAKTRILTAQRFYQRPENVKEKFNAQEYLIKQYAG